jgi:acetylornithine deacetylase
MPFPTLVTAVEDAIGRRGEAHLEMICCLVRASAEGDEAAAACVAALMEEAGGAVSRVRESFAAIAARAPEPELTRRFAGGPPPTNVVGTWKGANGGRSLVLFAHHDSPAPSGLERWRYPAFDPQIVGGRLYGWGAADDKSGVAAMIAAVDTLTHAGVALGGDVTLVSCVSKNRARGMAVVLAGGLRPDGCVYLHPAESGRGLREVKNITPGVLEFRITVEGRPPATSEPRHAPFAHQGQNAVARIVRVASALIELDRVRAQKVRHPRFQDTLGRSTNLMLGAVSGGVGAWQLPTTAGLECSLTFPPPELGEDVQVEVCRAVQTAEPGDPWLQHHPPVVEWLEATQPAEVPPDHPLFQAVSTCIAAVTGVPPEPYCAHAASDIRLPLLYAGIPAVGFGPRCTDIAAAGAVDESIEVQEFRDSVAATALLLAEWCGVGR